MEGQKIKRKSKFSEPGIDVILYQVSKHKKLLFGGLYNVVTNAQKNATWASIAQKVSAMDPFKRTSQEVRKKWKDLVRHSKHAEAARRRDMQKTGGGRPPKPLRAQQQSVINIIGETAIVGIHGALDTSAVDAPDESSSSDLDTDAGTQPSDGGDISENDVAGPRQPAEGRIKHLSITSHTAFVFEHIIYSKLSPITYCQQVIPIFNGGNFVTNGCTKFGNYAYIRSLYM